MVAESALRDALDKVVTAELLVGPVEQRDISYVTVALPPDGIDAEEVLVRHILYSPNDDSNGAGKLDSNDPAWTAAEAEANQAFNEIKAGTPMSDLAVDSDDTGSGKKGGLLGWSPQGAYVGGFEDAVWAEGLTPGDLLGPIKTQFGYHVIQFEGRRPPLSLRAGELAEDLATAGEGYSARVEQAKTEIDGLQAGDAGFVSRYSINADLANAAWAVPVGEVGPLVSLSERLLIVKVNASEQRELTAAQKSAISGNGFWSWLGEYRSSAAIKIDGEVAQEVGSTPAP
jgi:parvulin-like peptidyl-prolyl isomerase